MKNNHSSFLSLMIYALLAGGADAYIQQIVFPRMLKPKVQYNPPRNSSGLIDFNKYVIGQGMHYPPRPLQWAGGISGVEPIQFGTNGCSDAPINPGDAYDASSRRYSDSNLVGKTHFKDAIMWGTQQWNSAGYRQNIKDTQVGTQTSAAFFPSQISQLIRTACTEEYVNENKDGNQPNNVNNLLFSSEAGSNSQDMKNDVSLMNTVALTTSFTADNPDTSSTFVGRIIEADVQFNDTRFIFVYDCQKGESAGTSLCGRTQRACNKNGAGSGTSTGTSTSTASGGSTASTATATSSSSTSTSRSLTVNLGEAVQPQQRLGLDAETQVVRDCVHLKDVITHELGHVLGLDHSPDMNSTMFYQTADGQRTLEPDDVSGIYASYEYTGRFKRATNKILGTISLGGRGTSAEELAKVKGVFGAYVQAINLTDGRLGGGSMTADTAGNYEISGLREGFYALMLRNYPKFGSDMSFSFFRGFLGGSRYGVGVPGSAVDGDNWCANPFCTILVGNIFPSFNLNDSWKHAKFLKVFSLKNPTNTWATGEQISNVNFNALPFLDTSDPFEMSQSINSERNDGDYYLKCDGDDDPLNKSFNFLNKAWVGMYGGTGGKTTSQDNDSYTFKLSKGGKIEFRILAPEVGSSVDPVARLVLGSKDCNFSTDSSCVDLTVTPAQQVLLPDGHASKEPDLMAKCERRTFEQANLSSSNSNLFIEFFNSFYLNAPDDQKGVYITCHDLEPDTILTLTTWALPIKCENFPGESPSCNTGGLSYLLNVPMYVMSAYEYADVKAPNANPDDQLYQKSYALEALNRDANGQPKSYQTVSASGDRNTTFSKLQDTCGYGAIQFSADNSSFSSVTTSTTQGCGCVKKATASGSLPSGFQKSAQNLENILLSLAEISSLLLFMFVVLRKMVKLY